MEFEKLFNDSIEYTRETFAGHWVRWLIFILLSLPLALKLHRFHKENPYSLTHFSLIQSFQQRGACYRCGSDSQGS